MILTIVLTTLATCGLLLILWTLTAAIFLPKQPANALYILPLRGDASCTEQSIRAALRRTFTRAKNNTVTRNAIRNRVIIELEDRIAREIIDSYDNLTVSPLPADPTVCLVEFEFSVVHGLNRIYLTAHISI